MGVFFFVSEKDLRKCSSWITTSPCSKFYKTNHGMYLIGNLCSAATSRKPFPCIMGLFKKRPAVRNSLVNYKLIPRYPGRRCRRPPRARRQPPPAALIRDINFDRETVFQEAPLSQTVDGSDAKGDRKE